MVSEQLVPCGNKASSRACSLLDAERLPERLYTITVHTNSINARVASRLLSIGCPVLHGAAAHACSWCKCMLAELSCRNRTRTKCAYTVVLRIPADEKNSPPTRNTKKIELPLLLPLPLPSRPSFTFARAQDITLYFNRSRVGVFSTYMVVENLANPADFKVGDYLIGCAFLYRSTCIPVCLFFKPRR